MKPDFGKNFFEKYQAQLLAFVNTRAGRWFFGLPGKALPFGTKIMEIMPNRISYDYKLIQTERGWELQKTTDFRAHDRFQRRLEYVYARAAALLPISAVALERMMVPSPSLGFMPLLALTTTTFYPDNPPSTSCDGQCFKDAAVFPAGSPWSTIHDATDGSGAGTTITQCGIDIFCGNVLNQFYEINRYFCLFDTSGLTSAANISSASISPYAESVADDATLNLSLGISSSSPASNTAITTADFDQVGSTQFATGIDFGSISTSAYNAFALNASGLAAIDKTGISKFAIRTVSDITNTAPTWASSVNSNVVISGVNRSGTSQDVKLVVTYSTPTTYPVSASETPGIADSVGRAWTAPRSRSETVGLQGETIGRTASYPRALGTETVGISETFNGFKSRILDLLEGLPIADTFSRVYAAVRRPTDQAGPTDTVTRAWTLSRSLSEAAGITEIFSIGKSILRSISESVGITETLTRTVAYARALPKESVGITDTLTQLKSRVLDLIEVMSITENSVTSSRVVVFFNRVVSDTVTIIERFATPLNWIKRTKPTATWIPRQKP